MKSLMRTGIKDDYNIQELQCIILEIMVYIDCFCKENNIEYCLMGGSALGARRHQGFIPWDDDIDVFMTSAEYEKFKTAFFSHGDHEKYYLQEFGKTTVNNQEMISMAKLRMNGTRIEEKAFNGWKIHQGIFVDIFILHNLSDRKIERIFQFIWSAAVVIKGLQIKGYKSKNWKEKIMLMMIKPFHVEWILRHGLYSAYKYDRKKTKKLMGFLATPHYKSAVFPYEVMFPYKQCLFETVMLSVPSNNDEYLRVQYGNDYMTPPPVEKRPIGKHISKWKVNYKMDENDYSDEIKLI